jgi:hypothetical protein
LATSFITVPPKQAPNFTQSQYPPNRYSLPLLTATVRFSQIFLAISQKSSKNLYSSFLLFWKTHIQFKIPCVFFIRQKRKNSKKKQKKGQKLPLNYLQHEMKKVLKDFFSAFIC